MSLHVSPFSESSAMAPAWICHGGHCLLGEGLWFDAARERLFYTDILAKQLHCIEQRTGQRLQWPMPDLCCWIVGLDNGHYWLGLGRDLYQLDSNTLRLRRICELEPVAHNRLNDAGIDVQGRLWFGSMDRQEIQPDGRLFCFDGTALATPEVADRGFVVSNGPVFSQCGHYLWHANSALGRIDRYRITREGKLTERELFVQFSAADGYPDGMTVDADGGLWVAHWQGAAVSRFDATGNCTHKFRLPVSQVTNLVFAGPDYSRLFVTTASIGLSAAQMAEEPLAGALFELITAFRGLPATLVRTNKSL